MALTIDRAIFITNIFAQSYPDVHQQLWAQFEKEVPASQRNGFYGHENIAYVSWLKKKQDPVFMNFIQHEVSTIGF